MKATAQTTFAERAGRALGRLWRGCARLDRKANRWLVARGLTPSIATAAMLAIKVIAIGLLLYSAVWLALLLAFALAGAWLVRNDDGIYDKEREPEWRNGHAGFGLYTYDEHRIDPHVTDDD